MKVKNLYDETPNRMSEEIFDLLLETDGLKLERILSYGQATPPGEWVDQDTHEWVVLLRGSACLRFEGEEPYVMRPGDYIHIPAHCRHRVEWTDREQKTVWLALHCL